MKKAIFFLSPSCGGAERMTITIAKLLDKKEYEVHFVVIGRQIGEIKGFIPECYSLSLVKIKHIYDFTTLRIYSHIKKLKPQYVFCSLQYLNPFVIVAAKWVGGCKVIIRISCAVDRIIGMNKFLTQISYPKADLIIAQTETMQNDILTSFNLSRDKVIAIHNMIDKDTIAEKLLYAENPYINENRKIFVWVGRFNRIKGADLVIEALGEAKKNKSDICLYMIGKTDNESEQEYYQSVKQLVAAKGLISSVMFVGFQNNPYKWMKYADCFILSSRSEGSPNALFEALYLGVPSVATRCTPNIDDIIEDGVNGYKVKVGDSTAMADGMIKSLNLSTVKAIYSHSSDEDFKRLFL